MPKRAMFDPRQVEEHVLDLAELIDRIEIRFQTIEAADDFLNTEDGRIRLDAVCLVLIAIGETVKKIEKVAGPGFLNRYPTIPWKEVKGTRDFMAHEYLGIDAFAVFKTCTEDIPQLAQVVNQMLLDLKD